ncbi:hypothetical protein D3C78_1824620 [compost metagenome]
MQTSLYGPQPRAANISSVLPMIAWLTRSALATASMPASRQLAVQRKPSGWVALTLY